MRPILNVFLILIFAAVAAGCINNSEPNKGLSGEIMVDGSSTVYPITEAVAEEFQSSNQGVRVTVGISGTGGGFKKFCAGETDINDASRPIKQEELDRCSKKGIEFIELPVAFDGISVVVNPENTWVECLTVEELKRIWAPESKVKTWKDIRPDWPDNEIFLVGADTDSGTFDYFTKAIVGKEHSSRSDYTPSSDDNVLVQAVAGEKNALGYFGYAYYAENQDKLKLIAIDNGRGCIKPTPETIKNGTYQPLSRPLFIYIKKTSLEKPQVKAFLEYYLAHAKTLTKDVGYTPLPEKAYELALKRLENKKTGSIFQGGSQVGVNMEEILAKE